MWKKVAPCMEKYEAFLAAHKGTEGPLMNGRIEGMNEQAMAALCEFYLAVALRLRRDEIEEAGSNAEELVRIARKCAEEDFEPFLDRARHFVRDYSPAAHKALEDTCPLYEVDDGLFWRANFDVAAPMAFHHLLTAIGHGCGQGLVPMEHYGYRRDVDGAVDAVWNGLMGEDPAYEPARRAAVVVYRQWLEASSMPVKATVCRIMIDHGFMMPRELYIADNQRDV